MMEAKGVVGERRGESEVAVVRALARCRWGGLRGCRGRMGSGELF